MRYKANLTDSEDRVNRFLAAHPAPAEALAGVLEGRTPPSPAEPAFGSPEAVEQAAETIRRWAWRTSGMRLVDPEEEWDLAYYVRDDDVHRLRADLLAEVERLRTALAVEKAVHNDTAKSAAQREHHLQEQRDALAAALERLLERGADWRRDSLVDFEEFPVVKQSREALRKAGR